MQPDPGRGDRAGVELSFAADVEGAAAKGEREPESDEDERDGAHQRRGGERVPGAEGTGPERAEGRAPSRSPRAPDRPRGRPARPGAPPHRPPILARAPESQPPASMSAPSSSRVAPGGGSTSVPLLATTMRVARSSTSSRSLEWKTTAAPSAAARRSQAWIVAAARMSSPRVGFSATTTGRPLRELAAHHHPLLVAAAQRRGRHPRPRRDYRELLQQGRRPRLRGAPVHRATPDPGLRRRGSEDDVLRERHRRNQPLGGAVLGDEGDRLGDPPEAAERMDPTRDRAQQLPLAVSLHRRDADDLPRGDRERGAPAARCRVHLPERRPPPRVAPATPRHRRALGVGVSIRSSPARSPIIAAGELAPPSCRRSKPVSTTWPRRSTVTRSAAASASSSLWVMSTAEPP